MPQPSSSSSSAALRRSAALVVAALAGLGLAAAQAYVRPYYAGGPVVLNTTTLQYDLDAAYPIAPDFDLVAIDADSWGIPWDSFLYEAPLPYSWELKLNETIAAWAAWDRPLLLSLPMGDADSLRSCPALNASDAPGGFPSLNPVGGCKRCFDYNTTTNPVAAFFVQGFSNYALAMVAAFKANAPSANAPIVGLNFAIDSNLVFEAGCGAAWERAYVDFANQVYDLLNNFFTECVDGVRDNTACRLYSVRSRPPSPPPSPSLPSPAQLPRLPGLLARVHVRPARRPGLQRRGHGREQALARAARVL